MKPKIFFTNSIIFSFLILIVTSCIPNFEGQHQITERQPVIFPDYLGTTVPLNIAPMNFVIREEGKHFKVIAKDHSGKHTITVTSKDGTVKFPEKQWRELLRACSGDKITVQTYSVANNKKGTFSYQPFYIHVSRDSIDPFMVYRFIHPGYYSWSNIKIMQRSLESFEEASIVENQIIEKNCVNCHSFNKKDPEKFLLHVRGSKGGTYFVNGKKITNINLKTENMNSGATYPAWNPDGRFVAFSSNQVRQNFYAHQAKSIEVFDLVSTLILYDTETNEISAITGGNNDSLVHLETFPTWSPDGRFLYFCTATQSQSISNMGLTDIKHIRYNLAKKSFDPESKTFGETEIVFHASKRGQSVSFPHISPNGKYLALTVHDYGTFPNWHPEADLYLMDLEIDSLIKMDVNSSKTESWQSWSSNGKWLAFSSKRMDGRTTRTFFTHIETDGSSTKPFVLPQKDPGLYDRMLESFNIPELVSGKIKVAPRDFAKAANQPVVHANSMEGVTDLGQKKNSIKSPHAVEKGIHE